MKINFNWLFLLFLMWLLENFEIAYVAYIIFLFHSTNLRTACLMEGFGKGRRWWPTGDVSGTSFAAQEGGLGGKGKSPQGIFGKPPRLGYQLSP